MNVTRAPGHDLRDWAINYADQDLLRLHAREQAESSLDDAAAAGRAVGLTMQEFVLLAEERWRGMQ